MRRPESRSPRRWTSIAIGAVIAAQLLAASRVLCTPVELEQLLSIHAACPPALYPFLDYPMFRAAAHYGDELEFERIVAIDEQGRSMRLSPAENAAQLEALVERARCNDRNAELHALELAHERLGAEPIVLRVERVRFELTRDGFVERSCTLLASFRANSGGAPR